MSLLLTSCTMGKQPDRLLHKGPQYLRTRTNAGLFAQHRPSAVELLAASKAQFYSIKSSVDLDKQQDLAVSAGQNEKYCISIKKKEPSRSKSEYDLSQLHLARTEEESDENNNDISDDSINVSKDGAIGDSSLLNLHDHDVVKHSTNSEEEREPSLVLHYSLHKENDLNSIQIPDSPVNSTVKYSSKLQPKLTVLRSATSAAHVSEQVQENVEGKPQILKDEADGVTVKKPIPLPRKSKEKPVPPPRKPSLKSPVFVTTKDSNLCLTETASTSCSQHHSSTSCSQHISSTSCSQHNSSLSNKNSSQETPNPQASLVDGNVRRKHSLVESLTQRFTALSARSPLPESEKPLQSLKQVKNSEHNTRPESIHTYTATAIFIAKPGFGSQKLQAKNVSTAEDDTSSCLTQNENRVLETSYVNSSSIEDIKGKKRCPDVSASGLAVKSERRSISSSISDSKPGNIVPSLVSRTITLEKNSFLSPSKVEMSIESVDQAVCESEISAVPTEPMEGKNVQEVDHEAREITRSNSSLSGKFEQQSASPLSVSPTPHCSSVPRSYSDISCHLEGQHSRDSSLVSNHSRLSRASIGTDLENFFNQMGLERGVLDPINRLKELQTNEVFDSMSSLDSHDAASICSTYSRSEQEWSDSQSVDRTLQQTSIIERNARIIKWLCNVRKAKSQPQKSDNAAASNA